MCYRPKRAICELMEWETEPVTIYTFKLRDGRGDVEDSTGVGLPDRDSALRYPHDVVHELMRSREMETRPWCLEVYEGDAADGPI
jgi:hypothetical protein